MKSSSIGVIGEALVDLLPGADDTLVGRPGGSPANVAVALARLGADSHFLGRLSSDRWGRRLQQHLAAEGVHLDGGTGDEPTALAVVDLAADGSASYRFLWEGTADRLLDPAHLEAALEGLDALHVGSVGCLLEPGASAIAQAVGLAGPRVVSFDPNIRPDLAEGVVGARDRLLDLASRAHVVKASDEDLAWLLPDLAEAEAAHRLLGGASTRLVVVTRGADGAAVFTRGGHARVGAVEQGPVADTVGAGDAFMAALLVGLAEQGALDVAALDDLDVDAARHAARLGAEAAGVVVTRPGADPPTRADVQLGTGSS